MTKDGPKTVSTESGTEGSNPAPSSGESAANRESSTNRSSPARYPRVLLVEGRAAFADILRWNLQRSGFVVEHVG
jgi:hypothetical protein